MLMENIIRSLLRWRFDPTVFRCPEINIKKVIFAEFDMYLHHHRSVTGRNSHGWLRIMIPSLGLQAMSQDPLYYRH